MWRNIDLELWGSDAEGASAPGPADMEVSGRGRKLRAPEQRVRFAAGSFVEALRTIESEARRTERTVPTLEERETVVSAFWDAMREFQAIDRCVGASERARCAGAAREVLHPWLLRSDYWSRSVQKPHGYAGDFRTLEWMYDAERDSCADPTNPVVVNLLDHLYRTVPGVRAVWHRRRWYAELVSQLVDTADMRRPVRILDLACGGSRYVRDVIGHGMDFGPVQVTFLDQDPAALSFIRGWLPVHLRRSTRLICGPVSHAYNLIFGGPTEPAAGFDLVISSALLSYLDSEAACQLLSEMTRLACPGGLVALSNVTPEDGSRILKDWVLDWPLVYREASALRHLAPEGHRIGLDLSPDGGVVYALISVVRSQPASLARTR